jgi:diaminopimelate decarboxylase
MQTPSRRFVIVDAGMNDLIRPSLYSAFHFIWPAEVTSQFVPAHRAENLDMPGLQEVDVVGPVCESGDFLARGRMLPPVDRGDLLAVFTAGAYGMVMSSQYNSRPRAAEVLVQADRWRVIRRRETYDDLVRAEIEVEY